MRGKILGSLLLAGLTLIILVVTEMRRTGVTRDGCYAMSAPAEPTLCQ